MMKTLLKNHQLIKWMLMSGTALVIVVGTFAVYLNFRLKPILALQIKELVAGATQNLYHIEFSGITLNCLTGDASLRNVKLVPDTAVLKTLTLKKTAPNNIYYIQLKKLSVINVHPWKVYRHKRLHIDQIEVNHSRVTMVNRQYDFNENKPPRPAVSPYQMVSKFLKEVRIGNIAFKDASFKYIDRNKTLPTTDSIQHLNITLVDWLIDEHSAEDTSRFYLLKDIVLQLNDWQLASPDSLYHVQANGMKFTASTGALDVKRLSLVPRYAEMEFGKMPGSNRERFGLELRDLNFKGIDLPLYVKRQELMAKEMNVNSGRIAVFYNSEILKPEKPVKPLDPHQLLQTLPAKMTIRKLNLSNFDIQYTEYNPESRQKGKVTFERSSGTITNITNVAREKARNPLMEAKIRTYLMGQGELETTFRFDLNAKDGAFDYTGTLYGFNGTALNAVTKALGKVHIKSGMVKKLHFEISANEKKALGKLEFNYKDLAIAVLKKEENMPWYSRQGLLSFLANQMIIKPNNPDHLGLSTIVKIDYQRKEANSFFSFVWKTLFQGIRYSVGVTPEKEALMKAHIARFEKMKEEREKRRAAREKRKAQNR